jgi:hypothetical protein
MSETSSFQDYEECQVFQIFQISMTISISKNDRWDGGPRSTCATPRHSGDDLWSQLSQGIHAIHVIPKVTVPTVLWVQWARVSCLVVPVEEMNLETLDFATLDFNKDGFVCSLRRQPKNTSSGPWSDFDTATPKFRWIIQPSVGRDSHSSISSRAAGFYIFGKDGRMEG